MCSPVLVESVGSMYLVLFWCLVYVSITPHSVTAELDIYPEFADEVIVKRIQHVLTEWRQKQLRILRTSEEHEVLPQFTFHFPEESSHGYHSDLFAVPPSDPRYYQPVNPEADSSIDEDKRVGDDDSTESMIESEKLQGGTPEVPEEESWSDEVTSESSEPGVKKEEDVSYVIKKILAKDDQDIVLVAIIAGCGAAAAAAVVALSVGWYKLHNNSKAAADIEYPAYGVTGPNKEITPTGDRRLAQSAQMYHYQHQKQQIIAMESNRANNERRGSVSEGDSDEENEEGDYTVYECPGLAATGELEVKNPLFLDDPTPAAGNHVAEEPPAPVEKK